MSTTANPFLLGLQAPLAHVFAARKVGVAAKPLREAWLTAVSGPQPNPTVKLPPTADADAPTVLFQLVRASDLLSVRLAFIGFQEQADQLVRLGSGSGYLQILLPPQHIAELAFERPRATTDKAANHPDPDPILSQLLADPANVMAMAEPIIGIPQAVLTAAPVHSRICLVIPPAVTRIDRTAAALLDWSKYTVGIAADPQSDLGTAFLLPFPTWLTPPDDFGYVIGGPPPAGARWAEVWRIAAMPASTATGNGRNTTGIGHVVNVVAKSVVDSIKDAAAHQPHDATFAGRLRLAANPTAPFIAGMALDALTSDDQQEARVSSFGLSSLGGSIDMEVKVDDAIRRRSVVFGRDQSYHEVIPGRLAPFGHRAILDVNQRRAIQAPDGKDYQAIVDSIATMSCDPIVTYPWQAADIGKPCTLRWIEMLTQFPVRVLPGGQCFALTDESGKQLVFEYSVEGDGGTSYHLSGPAWFIADNASAGEMKPAHDGLADTFYAVNRQPVALITPDPAQPGREIYEIYEAGSLTFDIEVPAPPARPIQFRPIITAASIALPALALLNGTADGSALHTVKVTAADTDDLFATLSETDVLLHFGGGTARSGGLVQPGFQVKRLSRQTGLSGGTHPGSWFAHAAPAAAAAATPPPPPSAPGSLPSPTDLGLLLGQIALESLLKDVKVAPNITVHRTDAGVDGATFAWPKPGSGNLPISATGILAAISDAEQPSMSLVINVGAHEDATCTLNKVMLAIKVGGEVQVGVPFDVLSFTAQAGSKPDVTAQLAQGGLRFGGALSFLEALRRLIPVDGFSNPPAVDVTPSGVHAGYDLGLPDTRIGPIGLSGLHLASAFEVPFDGRAVNLRVAFASPEAPFLVTYLLLSGGGHLIVDVDSGGVRTVDAALDFGGVFGFSVAGIASGKVAALVGLRFQWSEQIDASGFFHISGGVELLGIAGISIDVIIALHWQENPQDHSGCLYGTAAVEVEIDVLFVSKSVSFSVERTFVGSGPADQPQAAHIATAPPPLLAQPPAATPGWSNYIAAFA